MICPPYKNAKLSHINQYFNGVIHNGVDWCPSENAIGTPLVAPENCIIDNIITEATVNEDLAPLIRGYGIIMKGTTSNKFHLFWHCLPVFPVGLGQTIKQGQIVAYMGNSGFCKRNNIYVPIEIRNNPPYYGTHLHQECFTFINGQRVYEDPLIYMDFSIPISHDLKESIQIIINKIINMFKK